MQQSKLWTKNFILIFIANFFVALNFYLLMTTLAVYAVAKFHVSDSVAGLAASMFVIGALVARLFAGKYIEVIGRKKMLFGSLLLFLVSTIFYFFSMNILFLLLIRFVNGVAFGIAANTMTTAIMDMIPKERMGEGAGYFALSPVFATAIGPFLGVVLVQYFDFNMVFITCTIFATITFITGLFAKIPEANLSKEQLEGIKSGFRVQDFFEMKALPISIVMFL